MKPSLLVAFLASSAMFAADNCDCAHFPIKPKACGRVCAARRLDSVADILAETVRNPDTGIPPDLASRAECLIVVPGVNNSAFVVGARVGHGFASCREPHGNGWTAPAAVEIEGGSFASPIGSSQSDLIMLTMNTRGAERLRLPRFTLGRDASVAAGPVGRSSSAPTDASMSAGILTYSRTRGVLAGMSIQGATLKADEAVNQDLYGVEIDNKQILAGEVKPPESASKLQDVLNRSFGATRH